jgi:hypothetical protein
VLRASKSPSKTMIHLMPNDRLLWLWEYACGKTAQGYCAVEEGGNY